MTLRVAIECGGTRSRAGLYSETGDCITSFESRGANPVDHGPAYVIALIVSIVHRFTPAPDEVYAAIAGVRTADLAPRIARGVAARLDGRSVYIADDVTPMLHENLVNGPGVLAIAGTGSCVMARAETGEIVRAGGRGALFGDPGSAYQTAVAGLRAAADAIDGVGPDTVLVETLPAGAGLLQLEEFRDWAKIAPKSKIAALAPLISHAADKGDSAAIRCLHDQATLLSGQVFAAAQRAQLEHPDRVLFHGGLVENATSFRDKFREALQARWPGVHVEPAAIVGHEAVARHALRNSASNGFISAAAEPTPSLLQTEQRSSGPSLDTLGPTGIVQSMAEQDARAAWASAQAEPDVANLIDATVQRFRQGGRIVYLGAGTSGRLGVLDASECHPTFGVSPERVIGIIAGGDPALRNSIEGAEDDVQLAVRDLDHLDPPLSQRDVVIGISASGTTPYVRAALD